MEILRGENTRFQKQMTLCEAQDLSKSSLIPAITTLPDKIASLELKLNTVSKTETEAFKDETSASQPTPAVSHSEHTIISADNKLVLSIL